MIPGLSQMMGDVGDEEGSMKLKRMIYIMDSMTEKELDSDGKCFSDQPTRMTRVARGSGTSVREVEDVLTQHRMMAQMAKKMGKNMANMQKQGGMSGQNRQQQLAAMQKRMQSMGGGGNMADIMKSLGGGGRGGMPSIPGMPAGMDLNAMMKQFGGMMGGGGMPGMPGMGSGRGRR